MSRPLNEKKKHYERRHSTPHRDLKDTPVKSMLYKPTLMKNSDNLHWNISHDIVAVLNPLLI